MVGPLLRQLQPGTQADRARPRRHIRCRPWRPAAAAVQARNFDGHGFQPILVFDGDGRRRPPPSCAPPDGAERSIRLHKTIPSTMPQGGAEIAGPPSPADPDAAGPLAAHRDPDSSRAAATYGRGGPPPRKKQKKVNRLLSFFFFFFFPLCVFFFFLFFLFSSFIFFFFFFCAGATGPSTSILAATNRTKSRPALHARGGRPESRHRPRAQDRATPSPGFAEFFDAARSWRRVERSSPGSRPGAGGRYPVRRQQASRPAAANRLYVAPLRPARASRKPPSGRSKRHLAGQRPHHCQPRHRQTDAPECCNAGPTG